MLLDRSVDLVTPLLTPLTFEGLIDEFVGIANGVVRIEPHLAGDDGYALSHPHSTSIPQHSHLPPSHHSPFWLLPISPPLAPRCSVPAGLDASGGRSTRPPSSTGGLSVSSSGSGLVGGASKEEVSTIPVALNSNDPLYAEFRDLNIEVLGGQLQDRYAGPARTRGRAHRHYPSSADLHRRPCHTHHLSV